MTIAENVARVRERMEAAARRADSLGENYVQEAQKKIEELGPGAAWHFIGHLQSNKAKAAVRLFDWVHSVDSLRLAQELSRVAGQENKVLPVLLQINLGQETTKFGALQDDTFRLLEQMGLLPGISVKGLMTLPPFFDNPEESRPYFHALWELAEVVSRRKITGLSMEELSMGMSNDFETAIEEGATLVRVGTAIFGPRPPK
jgi:pyridoxal phosphate enzyme (YggS family)